MLSISSLLLLVILLLLLSILIFLLLLLVISRGEETLGIFFRQTTCFFLLHHHHHNGCCVVVKKKVRSAIIINVLGTTTTTDVAARVLAMDKGSDPTANATKTNERYTFFVGTVYCVDNNAWWRPWRFDSSNCSFDSDASSCIDWPRSNIYHSEGGGRGVAKPRDGEYNGQEV